jgi:anti-repressor protein
MEIAKILNQMKVVVTTDLSKKSNGETKYLRTLKLKKKELFVAKDFAELLGYADTHQAIVDNCKKTTNLKLVLNQVYTTVLDKSTVKPYRKALGTKWATTQLIQEPDIWRLIIKSRLPEAEKIERVI